MSSVLEGLALFAGGLGKATIARQDEIKKEQAIKEKEAYERQRQAVADKQTAEQHDLTMKKGQKDLVASDLVIDDSKLNLAAKQQAKRYGESFTFATGLYNAGDTDGAISHILNTTNNDPDSPYSVDVERNEDGTIKYRDDGKGGKAVFMTSVDKKTGKRIGGSMVSPQQMLNSHGLMADSKNVVANYLEAQRLAQTNDLTYSLWNKQQTRLDEIGDGNALRDHNYQKDEAKFGSGLRINEATHQSGLNIKEGDAQAQRQLQVASQTPEGKLTLALTPYKVQEAKADATTATAEATTAQITASNFAANPTAPPPMTPKEKRAYDQKMAKIPLNISSQMGKNNNQIAGELVKTLGVDQRKARVALANYSRNMSLMMNEKDVQKAQTHMVNGLKALESVMPLDKFKNNNERIIYMQSVAGRLGGYSDLNNLLIDVDKYRNHIGVATTRDKNSNALAQTDGVRSLPSVSPQAKPKPQLTMPTQAPQAKQPVNNNTPYNGVQLNNKPVAGANQQLALDVLK